MSLRTLAVVGTVLGICYLAGVPVIDWLLSLLQVLAYVLSSLLWAFWQLLQPAQDNRHSTLPELHQAVLNVTNDAARVADLLDEFMLQYSSDPQLKQKFLTFMANQADTKYSVVDNKLNWVLWMYSLIWMPLLVLMCLTRMGKGPSSAERKQQQAISTAAYQQQVAAAAAAAGGGFAASDQAAGLRLNPTGSGQYSGQGFGQFSTAADGSGLSTAATAESSGLTPRGRRMGGTGTAGGSLDLPPRYSVPGSFGSSLSRQYADDVDGSTRSAASGRSLRSAMNSGSIGRAGYPAGNVMRASSDRVHMSRPSKLQGASSVPVPYAGAAHGGSRQKSMQGYRQGLNARLGSGDVGRQGSSSSNGMDVRGAGAMDQAVLGSSSGSSAHGWGHKQQQQQQLQHRGVMEDDAAAAADAVAM